MSCRVAVSLVLDPVANSVARVADSNVALNITAFLAAARRAHAWSLLVLLVSGQTCCTCLGEVFLLSPGSFAL